MVVVENQKSREDLTGKLVRSSVIAMEDEDIDVAMAGETKYNITLDGKRVMSFGEVKGVIRLEEDYVFLPQPLRNLVDDLREIGYRLE